MSPSARSPSTPPPAFLQLAAHPLRWQLMHELAASDLRARDLCTRTGARQSLVSYHLARLRAGGLVAPRRSSADGRDTYYRLELERCAQLMAQAGRALHPGLAPAAAAPSMTPEGRRRRVLFLCTGNGARSQLAQELLRALSGGRVDVESAGSQPKPLNPRALRTLRRRGVDVGGLRSKHLGEFAGQRFDVVISLCDRVKEVCPEFAGRPATAHWSIPDPAALEGTEAEIDAAFAAMTAEIEGRLRYLLAAIPAT